MIPKMFQIAPCVIVDISWKFHKNPFIHFAVMWLTDTPLRLDGRPWNSLVRRKTVQLIISCVVPDISWKLHKNLFGRFSIILPTITNPENRKSNRVFKGLTATSRKCIRIVLCLMCNLCWKFGENAFIHFPVMLRTDTDFPENVEKDFLCSRGYTEHPENVPYCSWYQMPPTLKI